jgi:3-hydroxymyristoyl/3-hydroxydecanoyl-(acyl carrier protein) dehydratase
MTDHRDGNGAGHVRAGALGSSRAVPAFAERNGGRAHGLDGDVFLPVGAMRQIDRLESLEGADIVCSQDLRQHWVFPLHFPGDPIFPGALLIEAAGQTVALWAWENGLRGRPRLVRTSAEFRDPLLPQDHQVLYSARVRRRRNVCIGQIEVTAAGRVIGEVRATLVITVDGD